MLNIFYFVQIFKNYFQTLFYTFVFRTKITKIHPNIPYIFVTKVGRHDPNKKDSSQFVLFLLTKLDCDFSFLFFYDSKGKSIQLAMFDNEWIILHEFHEHGSTKAGVED